MHSVSGTSKAGVKHRYYHCHAAKKMKSCEKKRITKAFVESTVIDYILQMLDNAPIVNQIVDSCLRYRKEKTPL